MTTAARRPLQFASLDDVMPDVERLLRGHRTVGNWTLAQICGHLAASLRRILDRPADSPVDPAMLLPEEKKREILATGRLPDGIPAPPEIIPAETLSAAEEAEALRAALARLQAATGPLAPHRLLGTLTIEEWHRLQCIHCAHHLSYAIPEEG